MLTIGFPSVEHILLKHIQMLKSFKPSDYSWSLPGRYLTENQQCNSVLL